MATTRRQFIKRSMGVVSASLVMPSIWLREARGQSNAARKIFIVIELLGGNDGLNTVIPYTDARYASLRPTLAFKESELKDAQMRSTIITNQFGFHPAMAKFKEMYDAGKVAIVLGAGYPEPSQSHFLSADIWHTTNLDGGKGEGWLGRYASHALTGKPGLSAVSITGRLPKTFAAPGIVIPNVASFAAYSLQTDPLYTGNRNNKLSAFNAIHSRNLSADAIINSVTRIGRDSIEGARQINSVPASYRSSIVYPANNPLAVSLKMMAQILTAIPEVEILYVQMGSFDHHGGQITAGNKLSGIHALYLQYFSEAIKAFYDDLAEHGLADNTLIMQWSEFGRRPNENGSLGTDHGTAAPMFIIGNPVRGGVYGQQPSLAATELDLTGNMKFKVDFREVYATVLDNWLGVDSEAILGSRFPNVGFLG